MNAKRTDTQILEWLISEGYVPELRRLMSGTWYFETDEDEYEGPTARDAIIAAMEALDG